MELLQVPVFELMKLWGELVEAYCGANDYGGTVAEIYAYRFQQYSPMAHTHKDQAALNEAAIKAGARLYKLLVLFARTYQCRVKVDGAWLADWRGAAYPFEHRVHVEIVRGK